MFSRNIRKIDSLEANDHSFLTFIYHHNTVSLFRPPHTRYPITKPLGIIIRRFIRRRRLLLYFPRYLCTFNSESTVLRAITTTYLTYITEIIVG